jgi:hypothetical protein
MLWTGANEELQQRSVSNGVNSASDDGPLLKDIDGQMATSDEIMTSTDATAR